MVEQLFGSKTRVKLLRLFYSNPNRSYFVREITRKIDEQINSVRRELANLLSIGILSSETNNNKLYYEINQKYEYYDPLVTIFGSSIGTKKKKGTKTELPKDEQSLAVLSLGNVEAALFTGQFTRDDISGVDFLVIGDINEAKLSKFVQELETKEGKEIRYTSMPLSEFKYRKQINDKFISNVLIAKKQILADKHNLLGKQES